MSFPILHGQDDLFQYFQKKNDFVAVKNDCVAVQIKSLKFYYVTVIVSFKMNIECLWDG